MVRAFELGNLCKLDGLRTAVKLKERFYMKGLLTIACNTFLRQGKLFPVASVWVTKSIILSQKVEKTNVRLLSDCARIRPWIEMKSQHVTAVLLVRSKSCKSFYFSQEAKRLKIHRKLMTSILKTFHHFNRSPADNKHRTRSYDLWRVTGNRSHA